MGHRVKFISHPSSLELPLDVCGRPAASRTLSSCDVSRHEVVLLHGQPGSASDWQLVADRLPGTLDVVALDRPGYGTSQQPAGGFGYGAARSWPSSMRAASGGPSWWATPTGEASR